MVKTGHSKRKLFTSAKEQKENTTPQDPVKQISYSSSGNSAPHLPNHHHHHQPHLHEGSSTNVPLRYDCSKVGSTAAAGQRPLPNIAGTAVASPGPGKHSSSAPSPHAPHDGRGGLACPAVNASPRPYTMPMSERQQIALLLQMSSPSPPTKGISNSHNSQSSVLSRCNSPYSPHGSGGGQDYPSSGPLYGGTAQLAQQHYSGMVTGSGGRGGGVAKRNERGETPLHVAAIRGDADRVHHLIARGSDVNAVDYAGWTALHEACNRGFVSVARELISAGACVNAKGLDNETPLHDACVNNHFKIVELLLESGASTTVLNRRGQTPGEVCRSPGILSLLRRAKQISGDSNCDNRGSESPSKMSRRTPPNNKLECAKMDVKPSDNIKSEKDIKTEDADDSSLASGSGPSLPSAGGGSSGVAQGGTASSGSCPGSGGTSGSSSSPGSPRITLRLPPSTARTPEKAARSASDTKGGEAGSDDPYEFKCSKDDPGLGTAGSTAPGGGTDTTSKGADGAAGEERGEKRPASEEDDEGEQAKKKKRKEDVGKEAGAGGGAVQGGKGTNRGGRATGEKSGKPAARTGPLHGAANPGFSTAVSKTGAGSGASSSVGNNTGFQVAPSATPTSSANSSVSSSSLPGSSSSNNSSNASSSSSGGGSSGSNSDVNRKSPLISASNSPKTSIKQEKCEDGSDDEGSRPDTTLSSSSSGGGGGGGGPKVPPLKIVLSSCGGGSSNTGGTSSQEQEQSGPQAGKSASARHLPYVVPANQVDQSVKEEVTSPPADCKDASHGDEPLSPGGSTGGEKSAPRITRSQRGTGSNSADEGSGAVKVEVKQEDHSAVTTTSSGSSGNSSTSATSNGGSSSNSSSSSTTAVMAPATITTTTSSSSGGSGGSSSSESVHPRKRKLNIKEEEPEPALPSTPEQPLSNCYQMFMKIRKQIDDRRKLLFPVQPKPPQGFKDYLMNRGTYVLAGNLSSQQSVPIMDPPTTLSQPLKELFTEQERDRYKLRLQHQIEREKLVLSVEQEILREHGRAARALANQALPFSACTVLRDQEVYNILTPEQEEKHRNARSRYNGRLFLSWLQDVDDKWEKIKESMVLRQQNEAESLNAVHRMDWEWKMKELGLCDNKSRPVIEDLHVPTVAVSDFDLLPA